MLKKLAILFAIAASSLTSAAAYTIETCMDVPLHFRGAVGTVGIWGDSFPEADGWRAGMRDLFTKINAHPANYRLDMSVDTFNVSPGNGESEMWFTSDGLWLNGAPAIAYNYTICFWFFDKFAYINEVDVMFDPAEPWTTSQRKRDLWFYGGENRSIQGTGLHELSHGLRLLHNNYSYNIMGDDFTHLHVNGSDAMAYLGEDASAGILALYGPKASYEDVGVSHWRYAGADGEYSMHQQIELLGIDGTVLPSREIDGEIHYDVTPGQWLTVRFTYENMGLNCQTVRTGYYLSNNSAISIFDRRFTGRNWTVCPLSPDTRGTPIRLPTDIARGGPMWLGVMMNDDLRLRERTFWGNATYIPMWVN